MALKNARLGRAEHLTPEIRTQFGLPERGLVIIESLNPNLRENIAPGTDIREYLLKHGDFKDVDINLD